MKIIGIYHKVGVIRNNESKAETPYNFYNYFVLQNLKDENLEGQYVETVKVKPGYHDLFKANGKGVGYEFERICYGKYGSVEDFIK